MNEIIKELAAALEKSVIGSKSPTAEDLISHLEDGRFTWIADLPISVVYQREKLKASEARDFLQADHFFDETGFSKTVYELVQLQNLCRGAKNAFQTADLAIMERETDMSCLLFHNKRPNDYWKRLTNLDAVKAIAGLDRVDAAECSSAVIKKELKECANGQWQVESRLRNAMRSKKENTDLRSKPFIWIVVKEQGSREHVDHVAMMLKHYFGENLLQGRGNADYYIAYMEELNAVSLRAFYKKA